MSIDNDSADNRNEFLDEIRKRAEEAELARIEVEESKLAQSFLTDPSRSPLFPPEANTEDSLHPMVDPAQTPPPRHSQGAAREKPGRDRDVAGILLSARENYERENYEEALQDLGDLVTIDPQHAEGITLRREVEKAKLLSDRMQVEEKRRKAEEAQEDDATNQFVPLSPMQKKDVPPQTAKIIEESQVPFPLNRESDEHAIAGRPNARRLLTRVALTALVLLGLFTTIVVYRNLRDRFFPPKINLLVLSPVSGDGSLGMYEGLRDDLILRLSHVPALRVFSPSATNTSRDSGSPSVARQLGAEYVLQWNVSEQRGRSTVTLTLIDAPSLNHTFDQSFTASRDSLSQMCSSVAIHIANALGADATKLRVIFASSPTSDAYDDYLIGRFMCDRPGNFSLDSVASIFNQSRLHDASFPYAESALGWTNVLRHANTTDTSRVYLDEAGENLTRALNLGGSCSEVYRLWGVIEYFRSNFQQAVERLQQAVILAPSDAESRRWLALAYLRTGKNNDALAAGRAAVETDPNNQSIRSLVGMMYELTGEQKAALREFEVGIRSQPDSLKSFSDGYLAALVATNQHERAIDILKDRVLVSPRDFVAHADLGRMLQLAGKSKSHWEEAFQRSLRLIEDTLKTDPTFALAYSYRGIVQTRLGLFADGVKSNKQAVDAAPTDMVVLYNSARMYALQRSKSAEALAYLGKAIRRRFSLERSLDLDLASLRNAPEFARVLAQ